MKAQSERAKAARVPWLLRLLKPLLPAKWRADLELLETPIPPSPAGKVRFVQDEAVDRLDQIEHIVVLMLENRSFDHMLGYLSLHGGREDVDGLRAGMSNPYQGDREIHHLDRTEFGGEAEDPSHSGEDVAAQLAAGNNGFAANFAKHGAEYVRKHGGAEPDPGLVMGYYDAADLPVYDFLASNFTICDRWFSSVPGATWPNRLYAVAGKAADRSHDDKKLPLYALPSFVRFLDQRGIDWRWYSFDPGSLRMIDPAYRLSQNHRFSFVDRRKVKLREEIVGELLEEGPSFLDDALNGDLPSVSWIDPHFKDAAMLGPDSNDDHAPSDVTAGQDLVLALYHALRRGKAWDKTLFLITYDEHGGFFDHVPPPEAPDDDPLFRRYGVRVPAIVVSPWVGARCDSTPFDHTSIIKTILLRFCTEDGQIPDMGLRTSRANHLGELLATASRSDIADHGHLAAGMEAWRAEWGSARFRDPQSKALRPRRLTELQDGVVEAARRLRSAGLPPGHP